MSAPEIEPLSFCTAVTSRPQRQLNASNAVKQINCFKIIHLNINKQNLRAATRFHKRKHFCNIITFMDNFVCHYFIFSIVGYTVSTVWLIRDALQVPVSLRPWLTVCSPQDDRLEMHFQYFLIVVFYLIPLIIMSYTYIMIARCLWSSTSTQNTISQSKCNRLKIVCRYILKGNSWNLRCLVSLLHYLVSWDAHMIDMPLGLSVKVVSADIFMNWLLTVYR